VVHSRDEEGMGVNHKVNLPKTSQDDVVVLVIKPNEAFKSILNSFKKLLQNLKNKIIQWNFILSN